MKTLKNLFLPLFLVGLLLQSCSNDDDTAPKTNTIADIAIDTSNLTILVQALQRTDLVGAVSGNTKLTVLAPTNTAFTSFLQAKGFTSLNDVPTDVLRNILLNHVIEGDFKSSDLSTGYISTMATSAASNSKMSLYVNIGSNVIFNGVSKVDTPNILADNGTIHIVDAVIDLPTVVTFAVADPSFSILESALTRESDFTYVATLSTPNGTSPAPFTVFAPTNNAFANLLTELKVQALSDIDKATLTSTLNTHVVAGANVLEANLSDNMPVNTLGGSLTVNITSNGATLTDAKGRVSTIVATDVQANNGVIHAINKVVLE